MTGVRIARGLVLAMAAGLGPGGARTAYCDTIRFVGARAALEGVEIVDERVDVVEYRASPASPNQSNQANPSKQTKPSKLAVQSIPSFEVADVEYSDPGEAFFRASESVARCDGAAAGASGKDADASGFVAAAEQFVAAGEQFVGAAKSGSNRSALAARALLLAGRAFARAGEFSRAGEAWERIEKEHPRSRYAPIALLERARSLEAIGDDAGAREAYGRLSKDERAAFVARLRLALLDAAATDTEVAVAHLAHECDEVESQAGAKYPSVTRLVRLGRGVVERRSGRPDAAVEIFRAIVAEGDAAERDVRAAAWNGIGAALASSTEASPERVEQALLAHLRVVTQFEDVVAEQPEALYLAARCFQRSRSADRDPRAADLLARCQRVFPGSRFARLALRG